MTTAVKLHFDTASTFREMCNCGVLPPTTAADGDETEDDDDDNDAGRPSDTERASFRDCAPRFGLRGGTGGRGFKPIPSADIKQ